MMRRFLCHAVPVIAALAIAGCAPPEPIKLGFVSTLSGRSADIGMEGRNGALLAVEEINASGGIGGRQVQLLVRDDALSAEQAQRAVEDLAKAKVAAVIGPMLSHMAFAMAPVATRLQLVVVSPTATADELVGQDDYLFRLSSPTSAHARLDAGFQYHAQGRRRIAAAVETTNKTYTQGYIREFRQAFAQAGGNVVAEVAFSAAKSPDYAGIVRELNAAQPDALLFVASAVDTARLAQHARHQLPSMPLVGVAWAGTVDLVQLGGNAVEGMYVGQYFNRDDQTPAYLTFKEAYRKRFRDLPGFGSAAAYDATRVVFEALKRKPAERSLKEALLTLGPFPGVQRPVVFDRYGDAERPSHITLIRRQQLSVVPWPGT